MIPHRTLTDHAALHTSTVRSEVVHEFARSSVDPLRCLYASSAFCASWPLVCLARPCLSPPPRCHTLRQRAYAHWSASSASNARCRRRLPRSRRLRRPKRARRRRLQRSRLRHPHVRGSCSAWLLAPNKQNRFRCCSRTSCCRTIYEGKCRHPTTCASRTSPVLILHRPLRMLGIVQHLLGCRAMQSNAHCSLVHRSA